MTRPILLEMTFTDLGLYRLDLCAGSRQAGELLDGPALVTAQALCAAINAGIADEAVFQALSARLDLDDDGDEDGVAPRAACAAG